jgi:hypothetical protein
VFNGVAYEIIDGDSQSQISMPEPLIEDEPSANTTNSGNVSTPAAVVSNTDPGNPEEDGDNRNEPEENSDRTSSQSGLCGSVLLAPMFFALGAIMITKRRRFPWIH